MTLSRIASATMGANLVPVSPALAEDRVVEIVEWADEAYAATHAECKQRGREIVVRA